MPKRSLTQNQRDYIERTLPAAEGSTGRAVLVLRYQHNGKTYTRVWRGHSYYHVIVSAHAAATRAYAGRTVRKKRWGPRQDALLREHYHTHTKDQIAAMLTAKFKQRFSKNMVISRWHGIKHRESK